MCRPCGMSGFYQGWVATLFASNVSCQLAIQKGMVSFNVGRADVESSNSLRGQSNCFALFDTKQHMSVKCIKFLKRLQYHGSPQPPIFFSAPDPVKSLQLFTVRFLFQFNRSQMQHLKLDQKGDSFVVTHDRPTSSKNTTEDNSSQTKSRPKSAGDKLSPNHTDSDYDDFYDRSSSQVSPLTSPRGAWKAGTPPLSVDMSTQTVESRGTHFYEKYYLFGRAPISLRILIEVVLFFHLQFLNGNHRCHKISPF